MLKGIYLEEYFIHLRDIVNWVLSVVRRELIEKNMPENQRKYFSWSLLKTNRCYTSRMQ